MAKFLRLDFTKPEIKRKVLRVQEEYIKEIEQAEKEQKDAALKFPVRG